MKMICEVPDVVIKCIKDGTWCGSSVAEKMIANGIPLSSSEESCEDTISRKAVLDTLENMDKALDEDRTVENYKELLRECYKVLPKSEWEHDHEILKAYSDGASAVLDKIRAEIESKYESIPETFHHYETGFTDALEWVLSIIDKYKEEGSGEE